MLMGSRQGRALRALREHEQMAVAFGVNPARLKMQVFIASAALAGLAGALYTFQTRFISPAPFGIAQSFTLLIIAIVGGTGYPAGAVVGAVLVGAINLLLQSLFSGLIDRLGPIEPVIFGVLLVVLLLRWPDGLWSGIESRLRKAVILPDPAIPVPVSRRQAVARGAEPLLELMNVSKNFGGVQALKGLSLKVPVGKILGLIGPNGAGKSTAFNVMSGLSLPSTGEVCLDGRALPPAPWEVTKEGIARTFQHVKLIGDMSVVENVAFGAYARGAATLLAGMAGLDRSEEKALLNLSFEALSQVGLADSANTLAGTLPLGKQRLVEIARALAAGPLLLLLDEPAAGLRAAEKRELIVLLHRLKMDGISVVVVEHDMELVMRAVDHVVVLDQGELLAEGAPAFVRKNQKVIDAYLGNAA
jgi:branched-chain amino acid transport system permease protein